MKPTLVLLALAVLVCFVSSAPTLELAVPTIVLAEGTSTGLALLGAGKLGVAALLALQQGQ